MMCGNLLNFKTFWGSLMLIIYDILQAPFLTFLDVLGRREKIKAELYRDIVVFIYLFILFRKYGTVEMRIHFLMG